MIEEAVGVSVFENKKKQNIAKIERCDKALEEIDTMIEESIKPKLEQLKIEQKHLNEYRNINGKYEQMNKIKIAYKYMQDKMLVEKADVSIESNCSIIKDMEDENDQLNKDSATLVKQVEHLKSKLDQDSGGNLKVFEAELNKQREKLTHANTMLTLKQENYNKEQSEIEKLTKERDSKHLANKKEELTKLELKVEKLQEENQNDKQMLEQAKKDHEAICTGSSKGLNGEENVPINQQIMAAKDRQAIILSEINRIQLEIENSKNKLNDKKDKLKTLEENYNNDMRQTNKNIESLEKEIESLDFNEKQFEEVKSRLGNLKKDCKNIEEKLQINHKQIAQTQFKYSYPDIDQEKIKGVVCNLFSVKSPQYNFAIAKAAGNRLFNVVVDDDNTATTIISKKLPERRTFLPLNKITGKNIDLKALRIAERLVGKGNVHYAINLVTFDPVLQNVMQYIFGDTMVCPNMDMAKKVSLHREIMKKTVTLEGELYDSVGTLHGGHQQLEILNIIHSDLEILNCNKIAIQQLEDEFNRLNSVEKKYTDAIKNLSLYRNNVKHYKSQLEGSDYPRLMKAVEDEEAELNEKLMNIEKLEEEKITIINRIKELEEKNKKPNLTKEQEKKEVMQHLSEMKKKVENSSKLLNKEKNNLETLKMEFKLLMENIQQQLEKKSAEIVSLQKSIDELNENVQLANEQVELAEKKYNEYESKLKARSMEISELQNRLNGMKNKIHENSLEIKKKLFEKTKIQTSVKEAKDRIKHLLNKYSWIQEEQEHFTSTSNEYRVLNINFNEQEFFHNLQQLKTKMESIAKSVNMKANIMHGEQLKEFDELIKKKDNTLKDKRKLIRYIENVEIKKEEELRNAWQKINVTFGSIFSTLLPNCNAKLVPLKQNCIREGLKIKVTFGGDNWKENLNDLSGGQRSLAALSLVLALLKFNPAPLYILDEVDAALDQSHTQNIGIMIRKHFKNAQVINKLILYFFLLINYLFLVHYRFIERRYVQ